MSILTETIPPPSTRGVCAVGAVNELDEVHGSTEANLCAPRRERGEQFLAGGRSTYPCWRALPCPGIRICVRTELSENGAVEHQSEVEEAGERS